MYYFEERKSRDEQVEERESEVYKAIVKLLKQRPNRPPSVIEIARACPSISSSSTTHKYLKRLRAKELIDWDPKESRTIRLNKNQKSKV